MAEVTAKIGTKLSEQEQQGVDRTKTLRGTAQLPPDADVSGQEAYEPYICPYCGCVCWVRLSFLAVISSTATAAVMHTGSNNLAATHAPLAVLRQRPSGVRH